MNIPMSEISMKLMFLILSVERENKPSEIAELYADFKEAFFSANVLQKRLEVLKIPMIEPTGVLALSVLAEGNPGRAILGMIETYEKFDEIKPEKINANFICEHVYPFGFYSEEEACYRFDVRKDNRTGKYDFIIN